MEINFRKLEKKILQFWKKWQIFEKTEKLCKGNKTFIFYQGPPYLNGFPHMGHFFTSVIKDVVLRFKTMEGYAVKRKAGWDTHGLPTENEVEKRLNLKSKKEIEKIGLRKFIKECQKSIFRYKKIFEKSFENFGFWLDYKNAYLTCTPSYIESVWFILKKIWEKKLLVQDFRVSPYCPRCQTVLSSHEVAQGYKKIKEPAIYVRLKTLNPEFKNSYLLIWTTTPWTLPANVAVAVNPEINYVQLKTEKEILILAKERIETIGVKGEIVREMKGKEMVGLKYEPPFDFYKTLPEKEKAWEVLAGNFISLEEGTGLVHIAPAFGEEDMDLIKAENLKLKGKNLPLFPIILNVDEEGKFKTEVNKWAGMFVKDADALIIDDLEKRNLLVKKEEYEHDYPFCWRCKTPLLYYAKKSWFIKISEIKEKLINENQRIHWFPSHVKEGRFGEWLKEVKDWALSRERYWGTPLPIWICKKCNKIEVIGGREDLRKQKFSKNRYLFLRHGESVMNTKGIIVTKTPENPPCPLTKKGKEQILKIIPRLKKEKIDLIFSSDLLRAKETAEIVAQELDKKPNFDKRLRDLQAGIFEGKSLKEYQSFWKNYEEKFSKRPKGGENYQDVKKRILSFLKELEKKYQGKTILLVGHQRPFAMLEGAVKGYSIEEFEEKIEPKKLDNGEVREIEFKNFPYDENGELSFHRPYVDEIKFYCFHCGNLMERVEEVIDCWFDSGAMPFAQQYWPFNQTAQAKNITFLKPPQFFPAEFIAEGIDQTRGWFYTLLAVSTLLGFDRPFKNVLCLGHVLDEKGEKMSKSKGNVVDPFYIIEKYGTDAARWYFLTINQPNDSKLFSENDVQDALRKFIFTFWNCYLFFKTYVPPNYFPKRKGKSKILPKNTLDKWIVSRLQHLLAKIINDLDSFDLVSAARGIEKFVVNDLSLWYIRRSRKRFQKPKSKQELKESARILGWVLLTLSKASAPFIPFLSEYIWQNLLGFNFKKENSIHWENFPRPDKKLIDKKIERKMERVREIVNLALAERQKTKIKVRQPLKLLEIPNRELLRDSDLLELIKEEINVKNIAFGEKLKLDTTITPELKEEGIIREVVRQIQEMRKKAGFKPKEKVVALYFAPKILNKILEKNKTEILKESRLRDLIFKEGLRESSGLKKEIKVEGETIFLEIKKIK